MESMPWRQGQELDELAPLAQTPDRFVYRLAGVRRAEPPEELDCNVRRRLLLVTRLGLQSVDPRIFSLLAPAARASAQAPCIFCIFSRIAASLASCVGEFKAGC